MVPAQNAEAAKRRLQEQAMAMVNGMSASTGFHGMDMDGIFLMAFCNCSHLDSVSWAKQDFSFRNQSSFEVTKRPELLGLRNLCELRKVFLRP